MSKKIVLILALMVILLAAIGYVGYLARAAYLKPLAAPLALEVQTTPKNVLLPTPMPEVSIPTSTTQPGTCGQSGVMTILVLARDKADGEVPFGADLIRFARVDFNDRTVRLIAVPRDLWVATPHLAALNLDHSRLGLVYYQVELNTIGTEAQIATAATGAVAQALYDNYGVAADHYIFFEMSYFAEAVDQLGGLDVNIPTYLTDGNNTFLAGEQHMDGTRALKYARFMPEQGGELIGGWNRMERQNQILKILVAKLLEPANIVKIPGLIQQFRDDFTTDLSPELITDLACMAGKVPQDQITNVQVEKSMITGPGPDTSMLANTEMIKLFLQQQLAP